jgi:hypothetical protein
VSHARNGPPVDAQTVRVPGGARRVLILGYYDGALDGVLEADTGDVYRFDSLAEPEQLVRQKSRSYLLKPLPADALDRLVAIIGPYSQPRWPAWLPVWQFPDEATRSDVETRTDTIVNQAGPVTWQISTDDFFSFSRFTADPAKVAAVSLHD